MPNLVDVLDSGSLRAAVYVVVAGLATWWGFRERRGLLRWRVHWWPTYWFFSALVLVTMGVARAGSFGDLLSEVGRDQARSGGWYDARRTLQVIAVVVVATVWFIGVIVAIWRVPPRRRRYLPHAVALSALIGFAVVRLVSLHHIDTVLYNRGVHGVRVVAIVELIMLGAVVFVQIVVCRFPRRGHTAPFAAIDGGEEPTVPVGGADGRERVTRRNG